MKTSTTAAVEIRKPWWKEPYVWLLIAGPLAVVLACVATFYLIIQQPLQLISEDYYRKGLALSKPAEAQANPAMQPAMQARNHAQTGVPAPQKPLSAASPQP
jgi:hypothetical protein